MGKRLTQLEIEALTQAYLEGESVQQIAARTGRSPSAVQARLHEQGVLRTREEYHAERQHHVAPSPTLTDILTGMLLSDASLAHKPGRETALLQMEQHPDRLGWLEEAQGLLEGCGVQTKIDTHFRKPSPIGGRILPGGNFHTLRTLNYVEFAALRHRWYPNPLQTKKPRKIVPRDMHLTPMAVAHWFCGDGVGGDTKGTLGFCTNGFTHEEVLFLVGRLQEDMGVEALKQTDKRGHPKILIGKQDEADKLKRLIEPHVPECCLYKFRHVHPLRTTGRGRRLSRAAVKAIQQDRGTCTMREAAERHGVSVSKVWKLWHES